MDFTSQGLRGKGVFLEMRRASIQSISILWPYVIMFVLSCAALLLLLRQRIEYLIELPVIIPILIYILFIPFCLLLISFVVCSAQKNVTSYNLGFLPSIIGTITFFLIPNIYFYAYTTLAISMFIVLPIFVFLTALLAEYPYTEGFSGIVVRLVNSVKKSVSWLCAWYVLLAFLYYLLPIFPTVIMISAMLFYGLSVVFFVALYETYKNYG